MYGAGLDKHPWGNDITRAAVGVHVMATLKENSKIANKW